MARSVYLVEGLCPQEVKTKNNIFVLPWLIYELSRVDSKLRSSKLFPGQDLMMKSTSLLAIIEGGISYKICAFSNGELVQFENKERDNYPSKVHESYYVLDLCKLSVRN